MATIAEILALRTLSLEAVVVPKPEAQARWVTISELADPSPFLEGGEILLTTGLIDRDADDWRRFVERLLEAGVVALGFAVGLSHPDVPTSLRQAATDLALNLFTVPRPVPFIAVSRAVADLLWQAERDVDRQALQHQQQLTTAALSGPTQVVETLAHIVGGCALLCGRDGNTIATSSPAATGRLTSRALPQIERMNTAGTRAAATEIMRGIRTTVLPVGVGSQAEAYLVVEDDSASAATQRAAITTAVALLTLDRARARVEVEADRRIRAGALSLALRSDVEAARRLLDGTSPQAAFPADSARVLRARGSADALEEALGSVERSQHTLGWSLVAMAADQLVAIVSPSAEQLQSVCGHLRQLEAGVGPVRQWSTIAQSDEAAGQALMAASAVRPVVLWSDLADSGVGALLDPETLTVFASHLLEPVLTRDDAEELVAALRAFLTHNGHSGPAAESLGVHRNTLRNRLATAESSLGRTLHDPQLRADLWVALSQVHSPGW